MVYANATILKVAGVSGVVIGGLLFVLGGAARMPWTAVSLASPAVASLAGALAVFVPSWFGAPPRDAYDHISRTAVLMMMAIIGVGALCAVAGSVRRERPPLAVMVALLVNVAIIALFVHHRFYAPGFDQDAWAPR
jgi:hypothetical protein